MKTSPLFWALFCFFLLPIGVIALVVTEIRAGKKPRATPLGVPAAATWPPAGPAAPAAPPTTGWTSGDTILPGK